MEDVDATRLFLSKLVLQGESILAEIVRLATGFVPKEFTDPGKSSRFRSILFDFRYFEKHDQIEAAIEKDDRLQILFYATYGPVITAFEQLFNSIFEFINTLKTYCGEFQSSDDSKVIELEINCLYICGLLLLYLDRYLPSATRERLYIAVFRRSDNRVNAEFLVDFLKASTSSTDTLIQRSSIPDKFVRNCVSELENLNIDPSLKISFMYTILLFDTKTLSQDITKMNKIVNSVYREQWVFNLGYGMIVNIFEAWYSYKAAWSALNSMISNQEANRLAEKHLEVLRTSMITRKSESEMANLEINVKMIRKLNRSLRWIILHSRPSNRGKTISNKPSDSVQFQMLLEISRIELELLSAFRRNLKNRNTAVSESKIRTCNLLAQLSEFFAHGFGALQGAQRDNFVAWVENLKSTVESVDAENVQQVQRRLKQVGDLLGLEANYTLREMLGNIDAQLRTLAALVAISEEKGRNICEAISCDYLWALMEWLMPKIGGDLVSTRNSNVVRQVFGKMSVSISVMRYSRLDGFCIDSSCSEVIGRIGNAWSALLEKNLRTVLQSVPQHLFDLMKCDLIPSLAKRMSGGFVEKTQLKKLESCPSRARLVEVTYIITNMSMGISRMMLRRIGTLPINPKELLEDGMVRQLYKEIKKTMGLERNISGVEKLVENCEKLQTMRVALIYMCEFMSLDGQMIWATAIDEYFSRLVEERTATERKNPIVEMIWKRTDPRSSRYVESRMSWSETKNPKIEFSGEMFTKLELALPFHALDFVQTLLFDELEQLVRLNFSTWRKISSLAGGTHAIRNQINNFDNSEFERLVRIVLPKSGEIAVQMAQIGQMVLVLKAIGDSRRVCHRIREDRMYNELVVCNRFLQSDPSKLPAFSSILARIMIHYSLFGPQNVLLNIRAADDVSPILLLAFVQSIMPKLGDTSFVCPLQLAVGLRFVASQTRGTCSLWNRLWPHVYSTWKNLASVQKKRRVPLVEQFIGDIRKDM